MMGRLLDFGSLSEPDRLAETEQRFPDRSPAPGTSDDDVPITEFEVDCAHADVFLDILEQSTKTYEAGGESALNVLADFDANWKQIAKAQAWAVNYVASEAQELETAETRVARELCSHFSARGAALLALRQAPGDRIQWSTAALEAARFLGDKASECMHLNHIGLSRTELGFYEEAKHCYRQVLAIADHYSGAHRYAGRAYINLALTCARASEYEEGIEHCNDAITIAQKYQEVSSIAKSDDDLREAQRDEGKAQNILGEIYRSQGKIGKALEHCAKALMLAQKIGDFRSQANVLGSLGNIYLKQSSGIYFNLAKAVNQYEQALAIYDQHEDQRGRITTHSMLGEAYRRQRHFDRAQTHFDEAKRIAEVLNNADTLPLYHLAGLHFYMALHYKDQGKWTEALHHAREALRFFEAIDMTQMIQQTLKLIEELLWLISISPP
jgi:tetratricopeptide (TPR) repeat protein